MAGFRLVSTPKTAVGSRRSASRSRLYGNAEDTTPTASPSSRVRGSKRLLPATRMPAGSVRTAPRTVASARPASPCSLVPIRRLTRMYDAQEAAAARAATTPTTSSARSDPPIRATPAAAGSAQARGPHDVAVTTATASGPRNSSVMAVASGSRLIATYRLRFMVTNTTPKTSTVRASRPVHRTRQGRVSATSTTAAPRNRSDTVPTGPTIGNSVTASAAPNCTDVAAETASAVPPHTDAPSAVRPGRDVLRKLLTPGRYGRQWRRVPEVHGCCTYA